MKSKPSDVEYTGVSRDKIANARPKLNQNMLVLYNKWLAERYNIHYKKDVLLLPPPWTDCPILRTVKFTNLFREDDRATRWLIDNVCNTPLSLEDKVLNCMLFRLYNKWETCELIGMPFTNWTTPDHIDTIYKYVKGKLDEKLDKDPDYVVYTSAFNTGGMKAASGRLTGEQSIPMRPIAFMKHMIEDDIAGKIRVSDSPKQVCDALMKYPGIGEFLSYQMFVDFTYCEEYPFSENHFTIAGPGCQMGINFLFEDTDGMSYEECIFWVRDNQNVIIDDGLFHLMMDRALFDQQLNVMCIENSFCEFSKYVRCTEQVAAGKRPRAKVSYDGSARPPTQSVFDLSM